MKTLFRYLQALSSFVTHTRYFATQIVFSLHFRMRSSIVISIAMVIASLPSTAFAGWWSWGGSSSGIGIWGWGQTIPCSTVEKTTTYCTKTKTKMTETPCSTTVATTETFSYSETQRQSWTTIAYTTSESCDCTQSTTYSMITTVPVTTSATYTKTTATSTTSSTTSTRATFTGAAVKMQGSWGVGQ